MEKKDLAIFVLMALFGGWALLFFYPQSAAQAYNSTAILNTTVNITNSAPIVGPVRIPSSIDLVGYATTQVICNVTVTDYDNNTASVNATLYYYLNSSGDSDDQNHHYTNSSCTALTPKDITMTYACGFDVNFFANNGTWYCNGTVIDSLSAVGSNISLPGTINPLLALRLPGEVLDFGQLAFGDISLDKLGNITNAGNRDINISVEGWGVTKNDNLAMDCTSGSILINNMRYNITPGTNDWATMYNLSSTSTMVRNFYIDQRTDEFTDGNSTNTTYWKLRIPAGAGGTCSGKILFTASDRGN